MKKSLLLLFILLSQIVNSQCNNGTNYYPSSIYNPTPDSWGYASTCNWAGEVIRMNIVSGDSYQFSTCNNYGGVLASYDTQLTLRDGAGNVVAFNDDYFGCSGYSSYINWTATYTGILYIHLNQYNCVSNMTCTRVMIYRTEQQLQAGPCTNMAYYTTRNFPNQQTGVETIACYYAGDYCQIDNPEQGVQYDITSTNPNDWITVRSGTYDGAVEATGFGIATIQSATSGQSYFIHVNVDDFCKIESTCRDVVISRVSALPVTMLYLTGNYVSNTGNLIEWSTASEQNSDYFQIEISTNGYEFRSLGQIQAAGNSTSKQDYQWIDKGPLPNSFNYYRLLQYDLDGVSEVYGPIMIDNRNKIYKIIKRIDMMGREVDANAKGVVIEIYEDGTMIRTINK